MEPRNLWAPWRIDYVKNVKEDDEGCFLCAAWQKPDEDTGRLVVHRAGGGLILLNQFPYTNGHLLVAPAEHLADLTDLDEPRRHSLMNLTVLAERLIQVTLNPMGINIGINIGRCAGAGLPGHLHVHLVPRWGGDTNFMDTVGGVRVIPQALEQIHQEMLAVLPRILEDAPGAEN